MKTKTSAPAVYVGTWAKYNNGSIEISAYILLVFFTVVDNFNHRG